MQLTKKLGVAGLGTSLVVAGALLVGIPAGAATVSKPAAAASNSAGNPVNIVAGGVGTSTATCPAGTIVASGGYRTSAYGIYATDSYKNGNTWVVIGKNLGPGAQTLTAYAYCASIS
jgi:hypothetical protein